jgi:hypothetical protein
MEPANVLKIESLSEGWCDKDHVLLHACFQLLSDFVEKEMSKYPHINWNVPADRMNAVIKEVQFDAAADGNDPVNTRNVKKEFEELYHWWQEWKKKLEEGTSTFEEGNEKYLKENEALKRLIDLRMYMWT